MSRHNCHHNDFIFKGCLRGLFNFEFATANVEDGSVDFGYPAFIAQFILPIYTMGLLPHMQDLQNMLFPVVFRPFLTNVLAGVEEFCLVRSLCAYAARVPQHGRQLWFVRYQCVVMFILVYFICIPTWNIVNIKSSGTNGLILHQKTTEVLTRKLVEADQI